MTSTTPHLLPSIALVLTAMLACTLLLCLGVALRCVRRRCYLKGWRLALSEGDTFLTWCRTTCRWCPGTVLGVNGERARVHIMRGNGPIYTERRLCHLFPLPT